MTLSPAAPPVLTVSQLTRVIKDVLERRFPAVWVRGEVSGLKRPSSGHLYFSLKEGTDAIIEAVVWQTEAQRLGFELRDGMEVEAFGSVRVWEPRGKYQLTVREMRPGGLGALLVAFEQLKRKLQAEGLFDAERKRPLPAFPERVGIVTSPVGAAVHDLVKVLRARWPGIGIVLAPVRVQGPGAAAEIAAAIDRFNRYGRVDLLIVGRGGGSIEDLWSFNEEPVARAIARSRLPVVSAVGHESDTTLADFAADVRAATPSNAAEIAVRDQAEVRRHVDQLGVRLLAAARDAARRRRRALDRILEQYGFRRQRDVLGFHQRRLDELGEKMSAALGGLVRALRLRFDATCRRYGLREWPRALDARRETTRALASRFHDALARGLHERRRRLIGYDDRLRALSPRLVLERGFCIARRADGTLVRAAEHVAVGDRVALEFARGEADARIEAVREGTNDGG